MKPHSHAPGIPLLSLCLITALTSGCSDKDGNSLDSAEIYDPWDLHDLVGVANMDDDDENGDPDWDDNGVDGDNDVAALVLSADLFEDFEDGDILELSLDGDTDLIRVWQNSDVILGEDEQVIELDVDGNEIELGVEFSGFLTKGTLTVRLTRAGEVLEEDEIQLVSAPLIMNHHLQWGEEAYALEDDRENAEFVEGFEDALGSDFIGYRMSRYGYDVWVQDEFEFATLTSPGHRMDVVIDSVRSDNGAGLDDLPEEQWEAPDVAVETWRGQNRVTSQDSFGNLEATPPVTVDGVSYPFGKIYWGLLNDTWGIAPDLSDLFIEQEIQAPFTVDITFLCVGHVDEFSTWIPDESSEIGFKLVVSDTTAAYDFLETLDPNTELTRYAADHGYDTIGEILNDNALRSLNEEIQEDYIDANLDIFMSETGISEDDIIRIPGIFEEYPGCGQATLALIPGTVNMEVFQRDGEKVKLLMPDPFLRTNVNDQSSDPFIAYVDDLLPDSVESYWIDDWDSYHLWMGEVHCGSNTLRTPTADWWTDASHLLNIDLDVGEE